MTLLDEAPITPTDSYIAAVPVTDLFPDRTYQRELDTRRAERMAATWERRLVGVLDVSDRGTTASPRYAIINGQHRWAAATLVDPTMHLAVNVHTGLTIDGEAQLFFDIDAKTKQLSTWDRWYARRTAGDATVADVERIAAQCGLTVTQNPGARNVQCCAALERIWRRYGPDYLADALVLLGDVWPDDPDAKKAVVIEGLARLLYTYIDEIDTGRLGDAMSDMTARQLNVRARDLQERGHKGGFSTLIAWVLLVAYNRRTGRGKLDPDHL